MDVYSYVATLQALMLSCLYVEHVESVQQFLAPTVRILYMLKANPENSQRQNTLRKRHCFYDPIMQNEKKTVILSTFPTNSDHQRGKSDNCNYHNKISDDNIEIIDGLKPWQQQTQPSCGTFIIYLLYIYIFLIYLHDARPSSTPTLDKTETTRTFDNMLGISSPAQKSHEQLIYIWRWTFLFGVIQFTTNHWETIADIFCRQHHCTLLVLLIWNYWLWLESKEPEVRRAFLTQASASVSCMCDTTRRPDAQTRRASFLAVTRASKELLFLKLCFRKNSSMLARTTATSMASRASAGIGARCGRDTCQQWTSWEFLPGMCHRHTWSTKVMEVTNVTDATDATDASAKEVWQWHMPARSS